jgi:hypothetical protein
MRAVASVIKAKKGAACLEAEGVTTLGELQHHRSEASSLGEQCASSLTQ